MGLQLLLLERHVAPLPRTGLSPREGSLQAESQHALRAFAFCEIDGRERLASYSIHLKGLRPHEVDAFLGAAARKRLEPRWLQIEPDRRRDATIRKVLQKARISQLLDRVARAGGGRPPLRPRKGSALEPPRKRRKKVEPSRKPREDSSDLEKAFAELCTELRTAFRREQGLQLGEDEGGFGSCSLNGSYEERHKYGGFCSERTEPDLVFFAAGRTLAKDSAVHPNTLTMPVQEWAEVTTSVSVTPCESHDLSRQLMKRTFAHAEKLVLRHPLCTRSHHVTLTGTRLRLWQFTPQSYATTRSYSFCKLGDRTAIGRILALLMASTASAGVLSRWHPPAIMEVQVPDAGAHKVEKWQWMEGSPKSVGIHSWTWGSRTVVFMGRARPIVPSGLVPDKRLRRLDLDPESQRGTSRFTMVKASFLPERLLGHEGRMQEVVADIEGTPKPIGHLMPADVSPSEGPLHTQGRGDYPTEPLYLHGLVYQHQYGMRVYKDWSLSEQDMCELFRQLVVQLRQYALRGAHYRDFNTGNYLWNVNEADGKPRLVLVDHGNMRLNTDTRTFRAIAQEDTESANPLFLPSGVWYLKSGLEGLRAYDADLAWEEKTGKRETDPDLIQREENEHLDVRRKVLLYSHSHLDDLESALYLHIWLGLCRSFDTDDDEFNAIDAKLRDPYEKRLLWESISGWGVTVTASSLGMSEEWELMMRDLRKTVFSAQEQRRERLLLDPTLDFGTTTPAELFAFGELEQKCFDEFEEKLVAHMPRLSAGKEAAGKAACRLSLLQAAVEGPQESEDE